MSFFKFDFLKGMHVNDNIIFMKALYKALRGIIV